MLYKTMDEFNASGKGDGLPRKTLLKESTNHTSQRQSSKKLPKITFSLQEDTDEDNISTVTGFKQNGYPSGPKFNNPLLPIHLNRDLSSLTSPIAKKFELPP